MKQLFSLIPRLPYKALAGPLATALLISFGSCTHLYYAPNTQNVPVFREKNEARVSAALSLTDKTAGDFQAAYAVTNHVAVLASGTAISSTGNTITGGKGFLAEAGAGYFMPIGHKPINAGNMFIFEVYGLLSFGGATNYYYNNSGIVTLKYLTSNEPRQFYYPDNYININYFKTYIQPSISFSHSIVDVIWSAKIGVLHTWRIRSTIADSALTTVPPNYTVVTGSLYSNWQTLNANRYPFLFEPALTIRVGYKFVKLQNQFAFTVPVNPFTRNITFPFSYSVGISIDIVHRWFKKRRTVNSELG